MPRTHPGEVWVVDLGLAAKVRPCVILSDYPELDELALIVVVPHTTAVRGNRWELVIPKPFLRAGAFHLQQIQAVPTMLCLERGRNAGASSLAGGLSGEKHTYSTKPSNYDCLFRHSSRPFLSVEETGASGNAVLSNQMLQ